MTPPRVGVWRAAELLTERLGFAVSVDAVEELAARRVIGEAGKFRGSQMYDLAGVQVSAPRAVKGGGAPAASLWGARPAEPLSPEWWPARARRPCTPDRTTRTGVRP